VGQVVVLGDVSQSPANHWITSTSGLKPKTVLHASITHSVWPEP
jgi:hypothetical protein